MLLVLLHLPQKQRKSLQKDKEEYYKAVKEHGIGYGI